MDWNIQSSSNRSALSRELFNPGAVIISVVYKDEQGVLQRLDVGAEELPEVNIKGSILGRWRHHAKAKNEEAKEQRWKHIHSVESFFISLFEEPLPIDQDREVLKHILALFLERKKILKLVDRNKDNTITYFYKKEDKIYNISADLPPPQQLKELVQQLQPLLPSLVKESFHAPS